MCLFSEKAKWIWLDAELKKDTYVSFKDTFNFNGEKAVLSASCETNYIVNVNGKRVLYGHFPNYPFEKYYEQIDITKYLSKGENELEITVFYEGFNSSTHIDDGAGLIYSIEQDGKEIAYSSANTLSGLSTTYISGKEKLLTIQIGYSQTMQNADQQPDYKKSIETGRKVALKKRPVNLLKEGEFVQGQQISPNVYDLSRESCGYVKVAFTCQEDCTVNVSYGEYLRDGNVARFLPGGYKNAGRDFSFDFICKKGYNQFEQFFTRMAGRYLQVESTAPIKVEQMGIIPVEQQLTEKPKFLTGVEQQIYDTCIRTLKLCMHEHYEDCPWREQALYALDSRNQMLCGYYAFEQTEFQKANLVYLSKGTRKDGFLELTCPSVDFPAIPFFSLMFIVACYEYVEHTKDTSLLDEVFGVVENLMSIFAGRMDSNNLLLNFDEPFWNFYEWSDGSSNDQELVAGTPRQQKHDLILNCAYLYTFTRYQKLCSYIGKQVTIDKNKIENAIQDTFYDKEKGLFFLSDKGDKKYSQLGNAFACLVGLGNQQIKEKIKNDKELVPATLSMLGFIYDALLDGNKENEQYILNDINKNYTYMLSKGATSFWETQDYVGETFGWAHSLCHGWSAMPIYYYNKLLKK